MGKQKKDYTSYIVIGAVAAAVLILTVSRALAGRVLRSSPGITGNTAGNLYNLGLFCERGDRIYFSNYKDDGLLYSMKKDLTDFRLVYNDKARYINADDHYLFYSRMNNLKQVAAQSIFVFHSNGVYRVKYNGKQLGMIESEPVGSLVLYDNSLFYQHYEEGKKLTVRGVDIAGKSGNDLVTDDCVAVCVYNDRLYYAGVTHDHYLHSIGLKDASESVDLEENVYLPIVNSTGIYYISTLDGYRIYRSSFDGSEKERLTDAACSSYNITSDGRYIFYQTDGTEHNGLECYDTGSGTTVRICDGDYKWINIAGEYVFFYSFDESTVYAYKLGGGLNIFNPPVDIHK